MFSKLFASERVLVEVDQDVLVQDTSRVVEVDVAVLALQAYQLAIFPQMLFKTVQAKFFKMPAKALERVSWAVSALYMAFQILNGVSLHRA